MRARPSEHWDKVYAERAHLPWDTPELPAEIESCIGGLPDGSRVLDVGCGRGQHSLRIARRGHEVVGIDLSQVAIEQARSLAQRAQVHAEFICCDATQLRSSTRFDLILDYSVFHHIAPQERDGLARSLVELLAEDGQLLVVCYSDTDPIADGRPIRFGAMGNPISHPSAEEVRAVFCPPLVVEKYSAASLGHQVKHDAHAFLFRRPA